MIKSNAIGASSFVSAKASQSEIKNSAVQPALSRGSSTYFLKASKFEYIRKSSSNNRWLMCSNKNRLCITLFVWRRVPVAAAVVSEHNYEVCTIEPANIKCEQQHTHQEDIRTSSLTHTYILFLRRWNFIFCVWFYFWYPTPNIVETYFAPRFLQAIRHREKRLDCARQRFCPTYWRRQIRKPAIRMLATTKSLSSIRTLRRMQLLKSTPMNSTIASLYDLRHNFSIHYEFKQFKIFYVELISLDMCSSFSIFHSHINIRKLNQFLRRATTVSIWKNVFSCHQLYTL